MDKENNKISQFIIFIYIKKVFNKQFKYKRVINLSYCIIRFEKLTKMFPEMLSG